VFAARSTSRCPDLRARRGSHCRRVQARRRPRRQSADPHTDRLAVPVRRAELRPDDRDGDRDEGAFDSAERSIWLLAADGSSRRLLVGKAGDGLFDEAPRWSKDGRFILYVEHPTTSSSRGRVYVIDVRTRARRGPLAEVGIGLGYYGLRDWGSIAAWYQP
jgi:hypothetical protein